MPTKINYIKPILLIMKHNFQLQAWWIFWLDSHHFYHKCLTSIKWHTFLKHFFLLFTVVKICTFYTWGVKFQIHTGCSFANGKSLRNQLRNIISFCKDPSVANAGMIFETGVNSKHTLILIPAYFRVILSIFFVRDSWNFKSNFSKVITIKSTRDSLALLHFQEKGTSMQFKI